MSEDNLILKMVMDILDEGNLENDIQKTIYELFASLENKYLSKANSLIESHKKNAQKSLSNEISLLNSIKPFLREKNDSSIDSAINMMTLLNVAKNMSVEMKNAYPIIATSNKKTTEESKYGDSSIHEDGVYDYDVAPTKNPNISDPMLPILVMMLSKLKIK